MCECLNLHMERALATKFGHFGILYLEAAAKNYQLEMREKRWQVANDYSAKIFGYTVNIRKYFRIESFLPPAGRRETIPRQLNCRWKSLVIFYNTRLKSYDINHCPSKVPWTSTEGSMNLHRGEICGPGKVLWTSSEWVGSRPWWDRGPRKVPWTSTECDGVWRPQTVVRYAGWDMRAVKGSMNLKSATC